MLVTKYVEELCALSNNGTQLQLWEHEGEKERRRYIKREEVFHEKDLFKKRKQIPSKKLRCGVFY